MSENPDRPLDREARRHLVGERRRGYRIDGEGRWWYREVPLDPEIARQFAQALVRLPDGRLRVLCEGEPCDVTCDRVPFIVRDLGIERDARGAVVRITLLLSGGLEEPLDPATLYLSEGDLLHCRVRGGAFEARFGNSAAMQFADALRAVPGGWGIDLGGHRYRIPHRPGVLD